MIAGFASRRCSLVAMSSATASLAAAAASATASRRDGRVREELLHDDRVLRVARRDEREHARAAGRRRARRSGAAPAACRASPSRSRRRPRRSTPTRSATTVSASPGLTPGRDAPAPPSAAGAPATRGPASASPGAESLSTVDRGLHGGESSRSPARRPSIVLGHGRLRLRQERRARDDDCAPGQPQAAHRLQAPRPEHPDVLAAHRRQRRVRGVLQGRAGRGRAPAGAGARCSRRTSRSSTSSSRATPAARSSSPRSTS